MEKHSTSFIYKALWFVLAQTDGEELKPLPIPDWNAEQALTNFNIERITFDLMDGNVQHPPSARNASAINGTTRIETTTAQNQRRSRRGACVNTDDMNKLNPTLFQLFE